MAKAEPFKFLTNDEFNRLGQAEKLAYLASAVASLDERTNSRVKIFAADPSKPKRKKRD